MYFLALGAPQCHLVPLQREVINLYSQYLKNELKWTCSKTHWQTALQARRKQIWFWGQLYFEMWTNRKIIIWQHHQKIEKFADWWETENNFYIKCAFCSELLMTRRRISVSELMDKKKKKKTEIKAQLKLYKTVAPSRLCWLIKDTYSAPFGTDNVCSLHWSLVNVFFFNSTSQDTAATVHNIHIADGSGLPSCPNTGMYKSRHL